MCSELMRNMCIQQLSTVHSENTGKKQIKKGICLFKIYHLGVHIDLLGSKCVEKSCGHLVCS